MNVTTTPAPKSSVDLEIELPPEQLARAVNEAVRRLARQTRVDGFRPGKAPRFMLERVLGPGVILDEAVDQLVDTAYREAIEQSDLIPLAKPNVEIVQAEEGKPLVFKASVPVRPEVTLGDYRGFDFEPTIAETTEEKVDKVVEELQDQHAVLGPVEGRPARNGDYAVIGFTGTREGVPFAGGSSDRMPLILGHDRLIPGFEDHILGVEKGGRVEFDITFPEDYGDESLQGQEAHFAVELKELREKIRPPADDDFARGLGNFADLAAMRSDIRWRLERGALDTARHEFADQIIEYAVSNASVELPDILVDQEVEVMHDELRNTLVRQGISEEAYLKAIDKTEEEMLADSRPGAEKRVKTLLVLGRIAQEEGIEVADAEVEAEIERARGRYADQPRLLRYFESERGQSYIRSTLRRSKVVEKLIDEWLEAHPEQPRLPHLEDAYGLSGPNEERLAPAADEGEAKAPATEIPAPADEAADDGRSPSAEAPASDVAEAETASAESASSASA